MRRERVLMIGMGWVLATGGLAAEGPDLADWLGRAQGANAGLRSAGERYQAAVERIGQAGALPDPTLQVTYFAESIQTRTGPQETVFLLSQRLPWFGTLASRRGAASAEAEAVQAVYQHQQLQVAQEVATRFYELGYLGRAIELTRENLGLLEAWLPVVEERVTTGGSLNALLRLKVELGKGGDQLERLRSAARAEKARLLSLMALSQDDLLAFPHLVAPAAEEPEEAGLALTLERHNPELLALRRQVESAEARRELARLARYPDFSLGLTYIDIGDPLDPLVPDAGVDPWAISLSVNLPLWRGKNAAFLAETLAHRRSAEDAYNDRLNDLRGALRSGLIRLEDANRRLQLYGVDLLTLARQAAENSRSAYQSGQGDLLDIIDSERSLLDLNLLYWRAAADAWQERVALQTLTNQPLP